VAPFQQLQQEGTNSVVYADFKCILEKTDSDPRAFQYHKIFSLAYYVHCSYDEFYCYRFRRDKDCVVRRETQKFSSLCKIYFVRQCSHGNFVERTMGDVLQRDAGHVCEKPLDDTRVRDHC